MPIGLFLKKIMQEIFIEEAEVMVEYGGSLIYGSIQDRITDGEHGPPLAQYLMDKFNWSEEVFQLIDWGAMKAYTSHLEPPRETNVIKLVMDWKSINNQNNFFDST